MLSKEGFNFRFDPKACETCKGNCCIGESGYIWVNPIEMKRIADHLKIDTETLKSRFLNKIGYKFSIKEVQYDTNAYACLFFDLDKKACRIYDARPTQCRTFPFWDYYKTHIKEVKEECPGIL